MYLFLTLMYADTPASAAFRDVYSKIRVTSFGSQSSGPPSDGIFATDPAAAQNLAGDTIVAARDASGSLYVNVFYGSSQTWGQWYGPFGATQGTPSIAVVPDGTAYIVARDMFSSYWLFRYRPGMGVIETTNMGGIFASDPSVSASPDGTAYVVGRDTYTSVWARHLAPGIASDWLFLGAIIDGKPAVTAGSDGAAYVIVRENPNGSSGNVWTGRLDDVHWSGWFLANAIAGTSPLALAATAGTTMFAAVADPGGSIYTCAFQTGDNGPRCPSWTYTLGVLRTFSASAIDYDLYIEGLDNSNLLWWYRRSAAQWTSVGPPGLGVGNTSAAKRSPPAPTPAANTTCPEQYHYWNNYSIVDDIVYGKTQTWMTPARSGWTVALRAAIQKNGVTLYGPANDQAPSEDRAELVWDLEDGPGTYSQYSIHYWDAPGATCRVVPNPFSPQQPTTFNLGDLSPAIISMVPEVFEAGSINVPVTIVGENFGAAPQIVIVEDPGFQVTYTEATDTRIRFNLTTPASTPPGCCYDFYVVSRGVSGASFQQTPGRPAVSDRTYQSATVVSSRPVRLSVRANGVEILPGDAANISPSPQMPSITARLVGADGQPLPGTVDWRLKVQWTRLGKDPKTYTNEFPANGLSAAAEWNPIRNDSTEFFGGPTEIRWTYNGYSPSTPFAFRIAGINPTQADALAELQIQEQTSGYWFRRNIAIHETTLQQFCPQGWGSKCRLNDPFHTNSAGYGMMQLDPPPTLAGVWNWRTHIADAVSRIREKAGPPIDTFNDGDKEAYPFYLRQMRQWRLWNANPNNIQVPPPPDYPGNPSYMIGGRRVRDFCQFTASEIPLGGPVLRWYGDATLMKQMAGTVGPDGKNANFLVWQNAVTPPIWQWNPATQYDADIVSEFCTCRTVATCVR